MPQPTDPREVARLRDKIFEDLTSLPTFAQALGKSVRAVQRMAKAGQVEIVRCRRDAVRTSSSARRGKPPDFCSNRDAFRHASRRRFFKPDAPRQRTLGTTDIRLCHKPTQPIQRGRL